MSFKISDVVSVKGTVISLESKFHPLIDDNPTRGFAFAEIRLNCGNIVKGVPVEALTLIERPKRIVKKTEKAWMVKCSGDPFTRMYIEEKDAREAACRYCIVVELTGTYEVEEDVT